MEDNNSLINTNYTESNGTDYTQSSYSNHQNANNNYNQEQYNQNHYNNNNNSMNLEQPKLNWSWGAFMFNIVWGIGNRAYLTLLCLVPFLNIIWAFVCGFKGKEWAWNSGHFKNAAEFNATQETWDRSGFVAFIIALVFVLFYVVIFGAIIAGMIASIS